MVSLRRRRLLGLSSGNSSFVTKLPLYCENVTAVKDSTPLGKPEVAHPVISDEGNNTVGKEEPTSSNVFGSNSSKEHPSQQFVVDNHFAFRCWEEFVQQAMEACGDLMMVPSGEELAQPVAPPSSGLQKKEGAVGVKKRSSPSVKAVPPPSGAGSSRAEEVVHGEVQQSGWKRRRLILDADEEEGEEEEETERWPILSAVAAVPFSAGSSREEAPIDASSAGANGTPGRSWVDALLVAPEEGTALGSKPRDIPDEGMSASPVRGSVVILDDDEPAKMEESPTVGVGVAGTNPQHTTRQPEVGTMAADIFEEGFDPFSFFNQGYSDEGRARRDELARTRSMCEIIDESARHLLAAFCGIDVLHQQSVDVRLLRKQVEELQKEREDLLSKLENAEKDLQEREELHGILRNAEEEKEKITAKYEENMQERERGYGLGLKELSDRYEAKLRVLHERQASLQRQKDKEVAEVKAHFIAETVKLKIAHACEMDALALEHSREVKEVAEVADNTQDQLAWESMFLYRRGFINGWGQHQFLNPGSNNRTGMDPSKEVIDGRLCQGRIAPFPPRPANFHYVDVKVSDAPTGGENPEPSRGEGEQQPGEKEVGLPQGGVEQQTD